MRFRHLVFTNVRRNWRDYLVYFLSSVFSVFIFYIFALFVYHPKIRSGLITSGSYLALLSQAALKIVQVVIVIMAFFFLWYAFTIFLGRRRKELSVYVMLGASEHFVRRMIIAENVVISGGAIVSGIGLGIIFTKLVLLVSAELLVVDGGLAFLVPKEALLLTALVFTVIFFAITYISIRKIYDKNPIRFTKQDNFPPLHQGKWYLAVLSFILLVAGYRLVLFFANASVSSVQNYLLLLAAGVLLTIAGTYLFFQQFLGWFLAALMKMPFFRRGTRLLLMRKLLQRITESAMMYFLITIAASVAFVGIGIVLALGSEEYMYVSNQSVACIYRPYAYHLYQKEYDQDRAIIRTNLETTKEPLYEQKINFVQAFFERRDAGITRTVMVISLSDYNQLAKQIGLKHLSIGKEIQGYLLSQSNEVARDVDGLDIEQRKELGNLYNGSGDGGQIGGVTLLLESTQLSLGSGSKVVVVSDHFFKKLQNVPVNTESSTNETETVEIGNDEGVMFIYDFPNWSRYGSADQHIQKELAQRFTNVKKKYYSFEYSSLYRQWLSLRQNTGLVLMLSVMLGAVFFTFAACVLGFRLYGDLDFECAYEKDLNRLGVGPKAQSRMLTAEIFMMFFLPALVAALHFAVAMKGLGDLAIYLPVGNYYLGIMGVYLLFQCSYFLICRHFYVRKVHRLADL